MVVRLIFDKYANEGYGAHRITTWLNNQGYRAGTGKMWHEATIRGILKNLTYTGILRCGEARSKVIPELQIISEEQYNRVQEIMLSRSEKRSSNPIVHLNTKGQSLLSGNIFCGHCDSRLTLTTSGKGYKRKDGTVNNKKRIRYICYGKSRKQTACDGQSGYTLHIINDLIDEIVRDIFKKMQGISKNEIVKLRYSEELKVRKEKFNMLKACYGKEFENLNLLKSEIIKAIKGESSFSSDVLSELVTESEKECAGLLEQCNNAEKDINESENMLKDLSATYDALISWADLYDRASFERKKMIVNCLINRVDVYRDYKLKIDFNIDFQQFINGIDNVA